ncbi:GNAT family N-acetyltransferase [Williamsia sp.]|uniref:GNAT family N-acetyltransferase n=1 Tax=Williamsia sp. TaxID=1872085 RepID=UPI001A1A7A50|nr:GNAT family N-acetyltransferase [Williamsia sp.]MBJ7287286.1 GNAT family N-acetyltransferase [Williamsia sp.]
MTTELRTHQARSRTMTDEEQTVAWIRAVVLGFNEPEYSDEGIARWLAAFVDQDARMRGVHDLRTGGLRDDRVPVATLGSWDTTVNVGGTLLPTNAISDVTTRTSHRRRGLLRQMMTADLTEAAQRGVPVAALTVSESGIYRRFGFGPAVQANQIRVRTDSSFRVTTPPTGRIEMVDRDVYLDRVRALFDDYHRRTRGSVDRGPAADDVLAGMDQSTGKPQPGFRYALHVDDDDRCDGAVAYKLVEEDSSAEVRDFVAPNPAVGVALWDFLGHSDLIRTITQRRARVDDPLRYALAEPDVYTVENRRDFLWLRVLDVAAVLAARAYLTDGELTLGVHDEQGFAAGTFRLVVSNGRAEVERIGDHVDDDADVALDVAALGSVLLGGIGVRTIAAAGHIRGDRVGDFARLMVCDGAPASITPF